MLSLPLELLILAFLVVANGVLAMAETALAPQAYAISVVTVTIGLTSFMLLFGELLPKRVGLAYPEKVAVLLAGPVRGLAWIAGPLLRLFELATDALVKLVGLRPRPMAD